MLWYRTIVLDKYSVCTGMLVIGSEADKEDENSEYYIAIMRNRNIILQ